MTNADYISRELLLKKLNDFSLKISGSANAMALAVMGETKKSIMKVIKEQPTAFDLDKVIRKLRNIQLESSSSEFDYGIDTAITILKSATNTENGKRGIT